MCFNVATLKMFTVPLGNHSSFYKYPLKYVQPTQEKIALDTLKRCAENAAMYTLATHIIHQFPSVFVVCRM